MSASEGANLAAEYEESWHPWFAPLVFFLPCFYTYGVHIRDQQLLFGYGFRGPGGWTARAVDLADVDRDSVSTGLATWKDNLKLFGGWGIRYARRDGRTVVAYNAANGPYLEFRRASEPGRVYRLVSRDAERVAEVLGA